jgi:TonB family protein
MVVALALLVAALGLVLYSNRDFWFPDTQQAEDRPLQVAPKPAESVRAQQPKLPMRKKAHAHSSTPKSTTPLAEDPAPPTTITRTILPPLEVEVVAGSAHQSLRPGSNSVKVDLQQGADNQETVGSTTVGPPVNDTVVQANITTNASEHSAISTGAEGVVSHSVQPGYPMLARQMKVQGAVTLQAMIGRDGLIQDLRVVSGPPILATAAREAVKQWHFKPHYEGADAVETQARITVNFMISTN